MRSTPLAILSLFVVLALPVSAQEVWDRESQSWSQKDVEKLLNRSHWARRVPTKKVEVKNEDKSTVPGGSTTRFERNIQEDDFVIVWWWSARTTRRAFLRLYEFSGAKVSQEEVQQFAESPITEPTISMMGGGPMIAVAGKLSPEELKKGAWLESSRIKGRVFPVDVKVIEDANGTPERILFTFPESVNGQPLVAREDKNILFRWRLPKDPKQTVGTAEQFEASFDPRKMVARGAADF